jgi:YHS domain-containing protein
MAIDPVCGMAVERERAIRLEWDGQEFYFCASGCRDEFINDPESFIGDTKSQVIGEKQIHA